MAEFSQLDSALLAGYLDNLGKAVVQQMLDLYCQQSDIYLQDINHAIENESQSLWQEHCHKMKGAAGSAGLVAVHAKLVAIEKSSEDWNIKRNYVEQLVQINQAAIEEFIRWLAGK